MRLSEITATMTLASGERVSLLSWEEFYLGSCRWPNLDEDDVARVDALIQWCPEDVRRILASFRAEQ